MKPAVSENLANVPVNLITTLLHLPFRATTRVEPVESIDSKNQQLIGEGELQGLRKFIVKMNQYAVDENVNATRGGLTPATNFGMEM